MSTIRIEIVYALREEQVLLVLEVEEGTSVRQAIELSGLRERFPDAGLDRAPVGIFGRATDPAAPLRDGDRVEIYRPLLADPKEVWRKRDRAAQSK